jgi:glycosyltransferase involved in cell wall biosynthesis
MRIELLVSRYKSMIGLARYTEAIIEGLNAAGVDPVLRYPHYPLPVKVAQGILKPFGYDPQAFFNIFPISGKFSKGSIKHFTHQMMGTLLSPKPRLDRVVITVHDIVPYLMRNDPSQNQYHGFYEHCADDLAMKNLHKADRIIAISDFTAQMLVKSLGIDPEKIRVVLYGMDHEAFHPVEIPEAFMTKFELSWEHQHILYVGSENPRKNLPRLFQAFAQAKHQLPNLKLVKIGPPLHLEEYKRLKDLSEKLKIEDAVLWIERISNDDLVTFYAFADAFVFPSLYEGFGLPPLEAMACGTPVISSNAASLPEVTGDAALQVDPTDVDGWAGAILRLLTDPSLQQDLRARGLDRAAQFTWAKTAQEMIEIYKELT